MSLGKLANKDVVKVAPTTSVAEAARMMDLKNVGCLLVMEGEKLIGVLTDRDIVLRVVNMERNASETKVSQVMTENPETLEDSLGLSSALQKIRGKRFRRFPVRDQKGSIVGIFTVDDLVFLLGKELSVIGEILERERALI
ncbi:MAG: CBS domain-containing protein [Armatimonadetes bacterium]|nr:CBS domain-containing protein [Armatimonadota bacterium]